jgi:hypothetical protein
VTPKLSDLRSYDTYPDSLACGGLEVPIVNVALPGVHPELYDPKYPFPLEEFRIARAPLRGVQFSDAAADSLARDATGSSASTQPPPNALYSFTKSVLWASNALASSCSAWTAWICTVSTLI